MLTISGCFLFTLAFLCALKTDFLIALLRILDPFFEVTICGIHIVDGFGDSKNAWCAHSQVMGVSVNDGTSARSKASTSALIKTVFSLVVIHNSGELSGSIALSRLMTLPADFRF